MADSDKILKLLIEMNVVDTKDVEAAGSMLDDTKTSVSDLAEEMGVLTVSAQEAERILKGTGEAAKEAGEGAKRGGEGAHEFNLHGREMHHLAGMLNRVLPGSGEALKAMAHSGDESAMAMIGLTAVIEIVSHSCEELERNAKAADEGLAAILDEKYDVEATRKVAEAWESATTAHDLYARSLAEQKQDDDDPSKGPIERASRAVKAWQSAQQEIDAAQKKLGLASIEEMEHQGLITHQQALAAKLKLDEEYEQRRLALAQQADKQELDLKQKTAEIVKGQQQAAKTAEGAAETTSAAAEAGVAHVKMELDKATADKAAGKSEMEKSGVNSTDVQRIRELYEKITGNAGMGPNAPSLQVMGDALRRYINWGGPTKSAVSVEDANDMRGMFTSWVTGGRDISDAQLATYEGGEQIDKRSDAGIAKLNTQLATREHDAALAKAELDRQKKLLDEKTTQLDKLQQEVDEMRAENQAKEQNSATAAGIDAQTGAVTSGIGKPVNPFAAPPRATTAAGPGPAPATVDAATIAAMNQALGHTNDYGATMAALAAQLERTTQLNHATTLRLVQMVMQAHVKHETTAQIVAEVQAQLNNSRTIQGGGW